MLLDAFDSNWIAPMGYHLDRFESEVASVTSTSAGAALSSGTAALHLALVLAGVKPGDEVLVPTMTFVATPNAVTYAGATPVFLDSEISGWNIDPDLLCEELATRARNGNLPSAVVAVDIYGLCADYSRIVPTCEYYEVPLIEDAAEALGASHAGQPAGSFGLAGVLSFNGNKVITTSGGGMLVSRNEELIVAARHLASQAREDAAHYEHTKIGYNYRLSNLLAAIGRGQLMHLAEKVDKRRSINVFYRGALSDLPGVGFMANADDNGQTNWLTVMTIDPKVAGTDRELVRKHLDSLDIEARPAWKPCHMQPVFAHNRVIGGSVAEKIFEHGLCLPSGSSMNDADLDRVASAVRQCFP